MSEQSSTKHEPTFQLNIERVNKAGASEPFDATLDWSDFMGNSTTVFQAAVEAQKKYLGYLSASYGYGSGWSISEVGGYGPGDGYTWKIQVDGHEVSNNSGIETIAISQEAGNSVVTFVREKL